VQALLLTIGSAIALWTFKTQRIIFPVDVLANVHILAAGFALVFLVAGGQRIRHESPPWEFRRATKGLSLVAAAIVAIGFLESHLLYQSPISLVRSEGPSIATASLGLKFIGANVFVDLIASGVFVGSVYAFATYESAVQVFLIGAQRVGKSLGMSGGIYEVEQEVAKATNTSPNPTRPLSLRHQSLAADEDWGDYNGPNNRGEYEHLEFQTQTGNYLPKYVQVGTIDYAGEYVDDKLAERVSDRAPKTVFSPSWFVYKAEKLLGHPKLEEKADVEDEQMYDLLARQILHSDKLLIMLDAGSIIGETPYSDNSIGAQQNLEEYVTTYIQILRHLDESVLKSKDVMVVVSKADYFKPLYQQDSSSLPFRQWVELYLMDDRRNGNEKIQTLLNMARVDTLYPVNFVIDEEESEDRSEPVPKKPIQPQGYEPLVAEIKE